jgi:hypothetical protein
MFAIVVLFGIIGCGGGGGGSPDRIIEDDTPRESLGTAYEDTYTLALASSSFDAYVYQDTNLSQTKTTTFTVTNNRSSAVSISVELNDTNGFSQTNNCTTSALAVGEVCHIQVTFAPVAIAQYSTQLRISSASFTTKTVDISGSGKEVDMVSVTSNTVTMGNEDTFTIANGRIAPVTIEKSLLQGDLSQLNVSFPLDTTLMEDGDSITGIKLAYILDDFNSNRKISVAMDNLRLDYSSSTGFSSSFAQGAYIYVDGTTSTGDTMKIASAFSNTSVFSVNSNNATLNVDELFSALSSNSDIQAKVNSLVDSLSSSGGSFSFGFAMDSENIASSDTFARKNSYFTSSIGPSSKQATLVNPIGFDGNLTLE